MTGLSLMPDKGRNVAGTLPIRRVLYQEPASDSIEVDRLGFGDYFGLAAEIVEIADSLVDSLEMKDGLMSVLPIGYTKDHGSSVSGPHEIGMNAKFYSNH